MCARSWVDLDDFMTPWSDSNPSRLVLKPPESRVSTNQSFFCVLEKTPLLLRFLSLKSFGDVFLKSSSSSPQNLSSFGLDLIPQSSRFPNVAGWKNHFWARANFFLSPVKPTLVICCVGSTGELVFRTLGFLDFLLGCTGALVPRASVQPVKLY